jgi:hypothetical protein
MKKLLREAAACFWEGLAWVAIVGGAIYALALFVRMLESYLGEWSRALWATLATLVSIALLGAVIRAVKVILGRHNG